MSSDRSWMWRRVDKGFLTNEFITGVEDFIQFAYSQSGVFDKIRCPCRKCGNKEFHMRDDVKLHLYSKGFTHDYTQWYAHGEQYSSPLNSGELSNAQEQNECRNQATLMDAMGPNIYNTFLNQQHSFPEVHEPNPRAANFFRLLREADEPIWPGCTKHTKLSAMSHLLNCKSEFNISAACYDRMLSIIIDMLPEGAHVEDTFYKTKKMLSSLGLGYMKIHACDNGCMLYYKETENLKECSICGKERYKEKPSRSGRKVPYKVLQYLPLIPRLQRLYMSRHTSEQMIWHSPRSSILARDEEVNNLKTELAIARNTIDENNEKIDDLIVRLERVERNHKVEMRETVRSILGELNIPNFQFPSSSGSRNDDV